MSPPKKSALFICVSVLAGCPTTPARSLNFSSRGGSDAGGGAQSVGLASLDDFEALEDEEAEVNLLE
ncbi:hypothetical protein B566_EDAN010523 [Ephemera danica]|nr:hypothetical protein B566_EDAN010523 [Ephemera danica]